MRYVAAGLYRGAPVVNEKKLLQPKVQGSMDNARYAIVILGASGDLATRKLLPALERLFLRGDLPASTTIVGCGRTEISDEEFRTLCNLSGTFAATVSYYHGIPGLKKKLAAIGTFTRIVVFMALPPHVYVQTAADLAAEGFGRSTAIIIEKPFGYDYASSVKLNAELVRYFDEPNIFRNDHYLAKEAIQNILVFRFANAVFNALWNNQCIESIQISAVETQGVGKRSSYFDHAGIIRDMVQNHLMQLLCLLTMESPVSLAAQDISARKIEVLRSLRVDQCFRSQYEGYRHEQGVAAQSDTETYAELKLSINNLRWAGVPVYIRTGKALNRTGAEIGIRFRQIPGTLFNSQNEHRNSIIFLIQPQAGILLNMASKEPGNEMVLTNTSMAFCYSCRFDGEIPEAYQRLLLDAVRGDHMLFVDSCETELSWQVLEPVLDRGLLSYYPQGAQPPSRFDIQWIDFEQYAAGCPADATEKNK